MTKAALRFVGFTRVSTEGQAEKGASLSVQKAAIEAAVARLGGQLLGCYGGGAEHGTAGYDKPEFNRLLSDAIERKFDAVMCYEPTRFTRDLGEGIHAYGVLRQAEVRLFFLDSERDLNKPDDMLLLHVHGAIGQHFAQAQKESSINSRIDNARKGIPSVGRSPWGRRYDEDSARWTIDPEAKRTAEAWAQAYVGSAHSFLALEGRFGVDQNTIRRRLLAAGGSWVQRFKLAGKVVEVPTPIPALLPDDVIEAIKARATDNRLTNGRLKIYPLAHLVRCAHCGSVLSGHTPSGHAQWTYYRHHLRTRKSDKCIRGIRADLLDSSVMYDFWGLLRSIKNLRAAIEDALSTTNSARTELEAERADLAKRLAAIEREQANLIDAVAKSGTAMIAKLNEKYDGLEALKAPLTARIEEIEQQLPEVEIPDDLGERVQTRFAALLRAGGPMRWKPEEQKQLALLMMGGPIHWRRLKDAKRGIFVERVERSGETFYRYEVRGALMIGGGSVGAVQEGNQDWAREAPTPVEKLTVPALVGIATEAKAVYTASREPRRSSA